MSKPATSATTFTPTTSPPESATTLPGRAAVTVTCVDPLPSATLVRAFPSLSVSDRLTCLLRMVISAVSETSFPSTVADPFTVAVSSPSPLSASSGAVNLNVPVWLVKRAGMVMVNWLPVLSV